MILASLLILISIQNVDANCAERILAFASSIDRAPEEIAIEIYENLIPTLTAGELHQLLENPLEVPTPENLTSISGAISILKQLLPLIKTSTSNSDFGNRIKAMADSELKNRLNSATRNAANIVDSKQFDATFRISGKQKFETLLLVNPKKQILYSIGGDQKIYFWDLQNRLPLLGPDNKPISIPKASRITTHIVTSSLGTILYINDDRGVSAWNAVTGDALLFDDGLLRFDVAGTIEDMALSPDDAILYIATSKGKLIYLDARSGKILKVFNCHSSKLTSLALSSDGKILYSTSGRFKVFLWDAKTGLPYYHPKKWYQFWKKYFLRKTEIRQENHHPKLLTSTEREKVYSISNITYRNPLSRFGSNLSDHARITIWDISNESTAQEPIEDFSFPRGIHPSSAIVTVRGKIIYFISESKKILVLNLKTKEPTLLGSNSSSYKTLALSGDEKYIFAGTDTGLEAIYLPDQLPPHYLEATP